MVNYGKGGGIMSRSADYTIQGFIYQFNKTLLEILNADDDSTISIEGIIEDIEITNQIVTKAIQCKYHEEQDNFTLSNVYKPILQMMVHYLENTDQNIEYKLYAHFPNERENSIFDINENHILEILRSKDKNYQKYILKLSGRIDIKVFLQKFKLEFGKSLASLIEDVHQALRNNDLNSDDVETLFYPNAIQKVAELSILHDPQQRIIKKSNLLVELQQIRKTAITKWTKSLFSLNKILSTKKRQLKANLDKNSRLRYFYISENSISNFNDEIVIFINEYLSRYHFKDVHDKSPLFCLDCSPETFKDIRIRLHKKGIRYNDGLITDDYFDKNKFLTDPIRAIIGKKLSKEYEIRLLHFNDNAINILNENKGDDLYIFSNKVPPLDFRDVNSEHIDLNDINQIKFIMGMSESYE
jgi:hypothetical protein